MLMVMVMLMVMAWHGMARSAGKLPRPGLAHRSLHLLYFIVLFDRQDFTVRGAIFSRYGESPDSWNNLV